MVDEIFLRQINVLTLNKEYFTSFLNQHLIKKALKLKKIRIELINFRDFSKNKHKRVDDYIYGGGAGMLLTCEPIYLALKSIPKPNYTILLTPKGGKWNNKAIQEIIKKPVITIICGRYEGYDERVNTFCEQRVSVGEFVTSNGELFAMTIIDSIVRCLPGLISNRSLEDESFSNNLIREYPQYTRPKSFMSLNVPDVLLNGNHKKITKWKISHSITAEKDTKK